MTRLDGVVVDVQAAQLESEPLNVNGEEDGAEGDVMVPDTSRAGWPRSTWLLFVRSTPDAGRESVKVNRLEARLTALGAMVHRTSLKLVWAKMLRLP